MKFAIEYPEQVRALVNQNACETHQMWSMSSPSLYNFLIYYLMKSKELESRRELHGIDAWFQNNFEFNSGRFKCELTWWASWWNYCVCMCFDFVDFGVASFNFIIIPIGERGVE